MGKTSQKRNIFKNGSLAFEGRGVKGYIYIGEVYLLPKCRIQKCKNQKCNFFRSINQEDKSIFFL